MVVKCPPSASSPTVNTLGALVFSILTPVSDLGFFWSDSPAVGGVTSTSSLIGRHLHLTSSLQRQGPHRLPGQQKFFQIRTPGLPVAPTDWLSSELPWTSGTKSGLPLTERASSFSLPSGGETSDAFLPSRVTDPRTPRVRT